MLEDYLKVDSKYQSVQQMDVKKFRSDTNNKIYWVMIWYFCQMKLPYEFLIPYEESAEAEDFMWQEFKVTRQKLLEELIKEKGIDYVRSIEAKLQKKFEQSNKAQSKDQEEEEKQPVKDQEEDHFGILSPIIP